MVRALALFVALFASACPSGAKLQRPYPEPQPAAILEHLAGLKTRAATLNAETKTDVRIGGERANVGVSILAEWGGKLRFIAEDPNKATAADLASDGARYCFVDVHGNCSECGAASADTVARLVRIPLEPDEVVAVLMGSTPVLEGAEARVEWQPDGGRELLTLTKGNSVQRLVLDGREQRWDVLESHLSEDGKTRWRIRHKDFHPVTTPDGKTLRVPGTSFFEEEGGDTVRIAWKDQIVGKPLVANAFTLTPPPGLAQCGAPKK